MGLFRYQIFIVVLVIITCLSFILLFINQPTVTSVSGVVKAPVVIDKIIETSLLKKLENPPEIIKAIYVTAGSARSQKYLSYLKEIFSTTQINAVVVDIKGSDGNVFINNEFTDFLHQQNIYVIGRIAVFEDPVYAKLHPEWAIYNKAKPTTLWKDNNGLSWMDPASKDVWDYNIGLAKSAFLSGFDEINFDYIRYPSDGKNSTMGFPISSPKVTSQSVIKEFFEYVRYNLQGETISADLFGQTTINKDDMGIGQILEDAFENFDYVSPMIYPSHYAKGFAGFENPARYSYEVVKYSLDKGLVRKNEFVNKNGEAVGTPAEEIKLANINVAKFRPWLQDFDMGAIYGTEMIKKQIKATQDALGVDYAGYMLWNASNIYTNGAIIK